MQSTAPNGVRERLKRWSSRRVDWWFAYANLSAKFVRETGFPADRITILNNAVDTRQMLAWRDAVSPEMIDRKRRELGLREGAVGIFVGSLYFEKRLDFLVAAARKIRSRIPYFQLLIVGDGPERERLTAETRQDHWIHWLGPRHGEEKVLLLSLAEVMLNPGLIGLSILDSFACRVPLFTTDCNLDHSPEIAYLQNEKNGIVTTNELTTFVDAVSSALLDYRRLEILRIGCAESAPKYTIENMATRFCEGIETCLKVPTLR